MLKITFEHSFLLKILFDRQSEVQCKIVIMY